jgi:uncharacterized protein YqeY
MKAKETVKLASLRAIKAAIMLAKTAEGATGEVTDQEIVKIIQKLVKQRKESAQQYTDAGRPELAENELAEAAAMEAEQRLIDAEEALADARENLKREEAAYADAQTRARREMGSNEAEASILQLDLDAISDRLQVLETVREDGYAVTAPAEGLLAGLEDGSFAMTNPYGGNLLTFSLDEVDAAFLTARTKLVLSREEQTAEVTGCTQNETGAFSVPVVKAGWEPGTVTVSGILWEESYDVCVPVEALRRDSGGHFLFVLDRRATLWNIEQTVRKVYVYPERMDGAFAAVTGLEPGYLVVVTSSKPLTEGSRIRVTP